MHSKPALAGTAAPVYQVNAVLLDGGPIIAQAAVLIYSDENEQRLVAYVLAEEHRFYPYVIQEFLKQPSDKHF